MGLEKDPAAGGGRQGGHRHASLQEIWEQRIAELPSLVVVESEYYWTSWLRQELDTAQINIRRTPQVPPSWLASRRPLAIALTLHRENYVQTLELLRRLSLRPAPTLSITLVEDERIQAVGVGLREAGANHIQYGCWSSALLGRLVRRFWQHHLTLPRDVVDEVIRRLPWRPR